MKLFWRYGHHNEELGGSTMTKLMEEKVLRKTL